MFFRFLDLAFAFIGVPFSTVRHRIFNTHIHMEMIRLDDPYVLFIVSRYPTTTHLPLVSDVLSLLSYLFWWDLMTFDEENRAKESLQANCICICISYIANKMMESLPFRD